MAEQAVISTLQALAINPCYSDFMRSIEQFWPELRHVAPSTVTIQNEPPSGLQPVITGLHVNPPHEQLGHSRLSDDRSEPLTLTLHVFFSKGGRRAPSHDQEAE